MLPTRTDTVLYRVHPTFGAATEKENMSPESEDTA